MESTRIRAPFDRAGDNDERREERERVGMGDRQRHADRRLAPVQSGLPPDTYFVREPSSALEEGTCKRFGS